MTTSTPVKMLAVRLAISEAKFLTWLGTARPGEQIVYHRGHLGADRDPITKALPEPRRKELVRIADRAMVLANDGQLILTQRRLDARRVAYLAIKATPQPRRTRP